MASERTFPELLNQARHHEREAVAALYRRALPVIYRSVYVHLGQPELVEDVVSEVFLAMVESLEQLRTDQEASFYAWLIQIAHRKVAHAIAQTQRHRLHETPLPDEQDQETEEGKPREELADPRPASDPAAVEAWK